MSTRRLLLPCVPLVLIALVMLACSSGNRQLQSITVAPASADAMNSNGEVQFTATGAYSDGSKVSPLTALWTINNPWVLTPVPGGVSIDSAGLGKCTGYVGTVTIFATAPADPGMPLAKMTMTTRQVSATAQLTCP
jgi:hypothetical protein